MVEWVDWSPDGRLLASVSAGGLITICDQTGRTVQAWRSGHDAIYCVAFSPDSTRLATSGRSSAIKVWDVRTRGEVLSLRGHTDSVYGIGWSPDGSRLATASFDRCIKLWDAGTGHEVLTLHGHEDRVWSVAWSPDGRRLVSTSDDGTVRIWGAPAASAQSAPAYRDALVRAWHHGQAVSSPDDAGALFHLRRLLELDPTDRATATELVTGWEARGRHDPAIAALRTFSAAQPGSPKAHRQLGDALVWVGRRDEAVAEFREAVRLEPAFDWNHYILGKALRELGRLDEAIVELQEARRLKPTGFGAPSEHGRALAARGRFDEAIAAYQEAIRLLPGSTAAHSDLGLALYRAGRWAEAITALETARKLRKGDDGRDGFVLAMAHWRQGDRDEARAWFDKAVQAMQRGGSTDDELTQLRTEAAALLGVAAQSVEGHAARENRRNACLGQSEAMSWFGAAEASRTQPRAQLVTQGALAFVR